MKNPPERMPTAQAVFDAAVAMIQADPDRLVPEVAAELSFRMVKVEGNHHVYRREFADGRRIVITDNQTGALPLTLVDAIVQLCSSEGEVEREHGATASWRARG